MVIVVSYSRYFGSSDVSYIVPTNMHRQHPDRSCPHVDRRSVGWRVGRSVGRSVEDAMRATGPAQFTVRTQRQTHTTTTIIGVSAIDSEQLFSVYPQLQQHHIACVVVVVVEPGPIKNTTRE